MATETQRSPMLQTESNPEGVMQLLVVFCGTHLCADFSARMHTMDSQPFVLSYILSDAAAANQQLADSRAPLTPRKTYSKHCIFVLILGLLDQPRVRHNSYS